MLVHLNYLHIYNILHELYDSILKKDMFKLHAIFLIHISKLYTFISYDFHYIIAILLLFIIK